MTKFVNGLKEKVHNLKPYQKFMSVLFPLLLLLSGVLLLVIVESKKTLYDENASERWDEQGRAIQTTVFFDEYAKVNKDKVKEFEYKFEKELTSVIGNSDEYKKPDNAEDFRYFQDSYMTTGTISLKSDLHSVSDVKVYGVGGDYMLFHPLPMASGSFLTADDIHTDGIVLDENTAWALFGDDNIVGQRVYVGDNSLYVRGVYKSGNGRIEEAAKGFRNTENQYLVFMSYDGLCEWGKTSGDISCYEMVSLSPNKVFIANQMMSLFKESENHMEIVNNSTRFDFSSLIGVMQDFGIRSMDVSGIDYPYFENIALAYEDIFAANLFLIMVFMSVDVILFTIYLLYKFKHRTFKLSMIKEKCEDIAEKVRARKKEEKTKWEHF